MLGITGALVPVFTRLPQSTWWHGFASVASEAWPPKPNNHASFAHVRRLDSSMTPMRAPISPNGTKSVQRRPESRRKDAMSSFGLTRRRLGVQRDRAVVTAAKATVLRAEIVANATVLKAEITAKAIVEKVTVLRAEIEARATRAIKAVDSLETKVTKMVGSLIKTGADAQSVLRRLRDPLGILRKRAGPRVFPWFQEPRSKALLPPQILMVPTMMLSWTPVATIKVTRAKRAVTAVGPHRRPLQTSSSDVKRRFLRIRS